MYEKPLPELTRVNRPYWEGAKGEKLLFQKCQDCKQTWFPPQPNCPNCLSMNVEWVQSAGRGKVWSWNVFHNLYFKGFKEDLPYLTVLVELEEGVRMISTLVGVSKDEVRMDMPVEVVFDKVTEECTLPKFKPVAN